MTGRSLPAADEGGAGIRQAAVIAVREGSGGHCPGEGVSLRPERSPLLIHTSVIQLS